MKKIISVALFAALLINILSILSFAEAEYLSDRDADGLYDIYTSDDLYLFASLVNGGEKDLSAELKNDITVNENVLTADGTALSSGDFVQWDVIRGYAGTFCGNGYVISGLYTADVEIGALFGTADGAAIDGVEVSDSYFHSTEMAAGICAEAYNTKITRCTNNALVFVNAVYSYNVYAGGICGYASDTTVIENCINNKKIKGYGYTTTCVGGVCAVNNGTVSNCANTGTLSIYSDRTMYRGNIAGANHGKMSYCYGDKSAYAAYAVYYNTGELICVENRDAADFTSGKVAEFLNTNAGRSDNTLIWMVADKLILSPFSEIGGEVGGGIKPQIKGDVNGDGSLNISDFMELKIYIFNMNEYVKEYDLNGDGGVNVADLFKVKVFLLGLE